MVGTARRSRSMYCQTSSSVQLLIGNTRMCSPFATRVLYRLHSSGRWFFGSHWRSEEHTSELQSRLHLVCRLLLEKKKKNRKCSEGRASHNVKKSCSTNGTDVLDKYNSCHTGQARAFTDEIKYASSTSAEHSSTGA